MCWENATSFVNALINSLYFYFEKYRKNLRYLLIKHRHKYSYEILQCARLSYTMKKMYANILHHLNHKKNSATARDL